MSTFANARTASTIVSIPENEPERLFGRDGLKAQYHALLKQWHPDVNADPQADAVIIHLGRLYRRAVEKDAAGIWETPGVRVLRGLDGKDRTIRFRGRRVFELGEILVADHILVHLIDPANRDLHERGLANMRGFAFADDAMRAGIEPLLPSIVSSFESVTTPGSPARLVTVIRKTPDQLLLADVLERAKGHLDPRHAAWILSCLENLACWLAWLKTAHQALSLENLLISPTHHTVAILGGWWYATPFGERITALPNRTVVNVPSDVLRTKTGDPHTDLALIRRVGRELVGDVPCSRADAPAALLTWLRTASCGDAVQDYAGWETAREHALGPRTFTALDLNADHLYPATAHAP